MWLCGFCECCVCFVMFDIVLGYCIIVLSVVGGVDSRYRDGVVSERRYATGRRRLKFVWKIGY